MCSHSVNKVSMRPSIMFSSVPSPIGSSGGYEGRFSRDPPPVFYAGGPCEQIWHGQECPLFDVVHPAFSLSTAASSILQGAQNDGLGEAVVACDMPEPCKFPSLDNCQKRFLWTHPSHTWWHQSDCVYTCCGYGSQLISAANLLEISSEYIMIVFIFFHSSSACFRSVCFRSVFLVWFKLNAILSWCSNASTKR